MTKRMLPPVVLVFGEDDNDKEAAKELMLALRPDFPPVKKRRKPLVLVRGRSEARARKNIADIAKVVRADAKRSDVRGVFAHEDCDDIEPAHLALADRIETYLGTGSRKEVDEMITDPGGSSSLDNDEGVTGHIEEEGVTAGRAWVP